MKAFAYTGFSISIDYFTQFVLSVVFVLFRVEIPNELQIAFIEKLGYPPCYIRGSQLLRGTSRQLHGGADGLR